MFAAAVLGAPLLGIAATVALLATEVDLLGFLGPLVIGIVLASGVALWLASPRLGAANAWATAVLAAVVYLAVVVGFYALAMRNANLR